MSLPSIRPRAKDAADPERGGSLRSSLAAEEPARKKARLHFEKCTPCRKAKKKVSRCLLCLWVPLAHDVVAIPMPKKSLTSHILTHHVQCVPVTRQWPEYCDRCKAKNETCTPNARSEGRPWSTPTATAPTLASNQNGSVEEDTADDQESREKRNRDSSTATGRTAETFAATEVQDHLEFTGSGSEDRSQKQHSESAEIHPSRFPTPSSGTSRVDSPDKPKSSLAGTGEVNDGSSYFTDLYERNCLDVCNLWQR